MASPDSLNQSAQIYDCRLIDLLAEDSDRPNYAAQLGNIFKDHWLSIQSPEYLLFDDMDEHFPYRVGESSGFYALKFMDVRLSQFPLKPHPIACEVLPDNPGFVDAAVFRRPTRVRREDTAINLYSTIGIDLQQVIAVRVE